MNRISVDDMLTLASGKPLPPRPPEPNPFSEANRNRQRARLRNYQRLHVDDHHKPKLTPAQLCQLLNYVLGLPVILGKHTIMVRDIPVIVVNTWKAHTRRQAENWIEAEMRRSQLLPKSEHNPPGRPNVLPPELRIWIPGTPLRRAA